MKSRESLLAVAFVVAAFAVYELVLFAWSLVVGERGAFGATIVLQVFAGNVFGLTILAALRAIVATVAIGTAVRRLDAGVDGGR